MGAHMIIGLTGKRLSGKDTAGKYLVENHGFERIAFADKLKEGVAALFDITASQVNDMKTENNVFVAIGYKNRPIHPETEQPSAMWSPSVEYTWIEFLQRFGTEMGRKVWGWDFWVDMALPPHQNTRRNIVVTDVRFENEAKRIVDLGGVIIRLTRPLVDERHDGHESEFGIPDGLVTYEIFNDVLGDLYTDLEEILEDIRANHV